MSFLDAAPPGDGEDVMVLSGVAVLRQGLLWRQKDTGQTSI